MEIILNILHGGESEMIKKISGIVTVIFISIMCSSCIYKNEEKDSLNEDNSIRYMVYKLPADFSHSEKDINDSREIFIALFDGLVEENDEGKIIPALCESFEIKDDGIEYRFNLREDIRWSTGEKITAKDFLAFFKAVLSPKYPDYYIKDIKSIYGAEKYHKGKASFEETAIKAVNDSTLVIRLNNKDDNFLRNLSKAKYLLRKDFKILSDLKNNYKDIACSGAFVIDSFGEDRMLLKRNPLYKDKDNNGKSHIEIQKKSGEEQALAEFYIKKGDLFKNPPLNQIKDMESKGDIVKSFSGNILTLYLNSKETGKDIYIKSALEKAILAGILQEKEEVPVWAQYSHGEDNYNKGNSKKESINVNSDSYKDYEKVNERIRTELQSARELLKKSQYKESKAISIKAGNTEKSKRIAGMINSFLKKGLSIKTIISYHSEDELKEAAEKNSCDLLIGDISYKIAEDSLFIPLFFDFDIWCRGEDINNLTFNGRGELLLKELTKDKNTYKKDNKKKDRDFNHEEILPIG